MREIKFKGKDRKGRWHYGYFWRGMDGECYIKEEVNNHKIDFEVINESVGQSTGLKDNKGKEIYEGDIIEWDDKCKGNVIFDIKYGLIIKWVEGWTGKLFEIPVSRRGIVIGNIYENPDLLEARK